jgi:hypothetical protein
VACKVNSTKEPITIVDSSSRYETGSPASGNFSADEYDLKDYSEFSYIDSTRDVFGNSYIDTFSIAGTRFRVVHEFVDTFPQTATIEKLVGDKWLKRIEFYKANHFGDFHYNEDVNNDGYNDIVRESRFDSEVYFYNPSIKNFIDSVGAEINHDIYLIDTANKVFCDFQELKGLCEQITSTLYTFKDFRRYDFYQLELYNCDNADTITKLILKKCINGSSDSLKELEEIKLNKPIGTDTYDKNGMQTYFDHKAYWSKRYKKFLSSK